MAKLLALAILVIAVSCYEAESGPVEYKGYCVEGAKYFNNCGWCQCLGGLPWCPDVKCPNEVGPSDDFWLKWKPVWNIDWETYWSNYRDYYNHYYPKGKYGWIPRLPYKEPKKEVVVDDVPKDEEPKEDLKLPETLYGRKYTWLY